MREDEIINDLNGAMASIDPVPSNWVIGITNDIERHMREHGATQALFQRASTSAVARRIERYFLNLGCDGGPGGGGFDAVFVYLVHQDDL